MAQFSFPGSVFVITGAGGILGGGCAVKLAKSGAQLALLDINADKLQGTVDKCRARGLDTTKLLSLHTDVRIQAQVDDAISETYHHFGKIDVVINVVGGRRLGRFEDCVLDDLDEALDGCVKSTFLMSKAALPYLKTTKGCIINISSISGVTPFHSWLPTGTAKAAVNHLTKAMAADLARYGVRVNAVAPALIHDDDENRITPAVRKAYEHGSKAVPLGRVGRVQEVVDTVLFFASPSAGFTTGQVLTVDGAYSQTIKEA